METVQEPAAASGHPVIIAWSDNADRVQNVNVTVTRTLGVSKKTIAILVVCGIAIFVVFAYVLLTVFTQITIIPKKDLAPQVIPTKVTLQNSIIINLTSMVFETSTTFVVTVAVPSTTTHVPTIMTTEETTSTEFVDETSASSTCSSNERPCMSSSLCISSDSMCDKRSDCPFADDEKHCTCLDYLTNQFPQRICDNYPDCPDLSDEIDCSYKCSNDEFRCSIDGDCINRELLCDGVDNCVDGQDESLCWSLAPAIEALNDAHSMDTFSYGYLFGRIRGTWYPACIDQDITVTETRDLCNALGFRKLISYRNDPATSKFETVINFTRYHDISMSSQDVLSDDCSSRSFAHVQCAGESTIECASRPFCGPNLKRIVGGSPAGPYCQPGVVALYKDGELTCQATVFNHEWLLTAAHCFYEKPCLLYRATSSRWIARLGFYRQHSQSPYEQIRSIEYVIFHPNFTDTPVEVDDLALLKMDRPIHFGANVKPPCLPIIDVQGSSTVPAPGDACVTTGWGYDHENSRRTVDELRSVVLTSVDIDVCNRSGPFKGLLTDGHLCFNSGTASPKDACQGDSGGPMMCYSDRDDKLYLAGITSAGFGCARRNTPSLWTKVSYYVPWILSALNSTDGDRTTFTKINPAPCPEFLCSYGDCISSKKRCDGAWDCKLSGYDELDCANPAHIINNETVNLDHIGVKYCSWNTARENSTDALFHCSSTDALPEMCIKPYRICDGFLDCPGGEDERSKELCFSEH